MADKDLSDADGLMTIAEKQFLSTYSHHVKVRIYLANGVKLECTIEKWDDVCLVVSQNNSSKPQLVYKTSIASIAPI
jgi:RNA chaperone Hfq